MNRSNSAPTSPAPGDGVRRIAAPVVLQARWVLPMQGEPLPDGQLRVEQGRVVELGRRLTTRALDLGPCVLLPGLVNPHCHLEFSTLRQPLGHSGVAFPDWVQQVIQWRSSQQASSAVEPQAPWRQGLEEATARGTAVLGEILSHPAQHIPPAEWPRLVVFFELLGPTPTRAEEAKARAEAFFRHVPDRRWLGWGLSPHAPYTVHPRLLAWAVAQSRQRRVPLQFHLAESPAELELLRRGTGPLAELLRRAGAWCPDVFASPVRPLELLQAMQKAHRVLVVHGNYLSTEEHRYLAGQRKRFSLVFCPRTHAYFRHEKYPLAELVAQGVRVVLGTDSRASSPDLALLEEARFAAAEHRLDPHVLLRMITRDAARALGLESTWGRIVPGAPAVFTLVYPAEDTPPRTGTEAAEAILHGKLRRVELLVCTAECSPTMPR